MHKYQASLLALLSLATPIFGLSCSTTFDCYNGSVCSNGFCMSENQYISTPENGGAGGLLGVLAVFVIIGLIACFSCHHCGGCGHGGGHFFSVPSSGHIYEGHHGGGHHGGYYEGHHGGGHHGGGHHGGHH